MSENFSLDSSAFFYYICNIYEKEKAEYLNDLGGSRVACYCICYALILAAVRIAEGQGEGHRPA